MEAEDPDGSTASGSPAPRPVDLDDALDAGAVDPAELDRAEAELAAVERSLERLDDGTYATCEVCGGPIDDDRLVADATTRRCAEHR